MRLPRTLLTSAAALALLGGLSGCDSPSGAADPLDRIEIQGDAQSAAAGTEVPIVVRAVDAGGDPVAGVVVQFVVTAGGGSVFAASGQTNADGIVQNRWTLGTLAADSQRVEVRATDPATGSVRTYATLHATVLHGPAAALVPVGAANRYGAPGVLLQDSPAVRVRDAYGNDVSGATVTWAVTAGGGSVAPAQSVTGADGIARTGWTLGPAADAQRVTASVGAASTSLTALAPSEANTTVVLASPAFVSAPVGQTRGVTFNVRSGGVPLAGMRVEYTVQGGGTVDLATGLTNDAGDITVNWTMGPTPGEQRLVARFAGAITRTLIVQAYAPSTVTSANLGMFNESGGWVTAGRPYEVVATVRGPEGRPAVGAVVTWEVTSGPGHFAQTQSVSDTAGVARNTLDVGAVSGPRIGIRITSGTFSRDGTAEILPGPVVRLDAESDSLTVAAGQVVFSRVTGYDAFGNPGFSDIFGRGYRMPLVTWQPTDPAVATVGLFARSVQDTYWNYRVDAHQAGQTQIIFAAAGVQGDTVTVTVTP